MKPSGVLSGVDSAPCRTNSSRSVPLRSLRTMSLCSCSTMRRGVPVGATMPYQLSNCASGSPNSAIAGTAGSAGLRCGVITASARKCLSRTAPSTAGSV